MEIKLYYHPKTRAFRVRWLLEELGANYQLQYVDLFGGEANSEWYRAIHPHGCLPAVEIDGRVMIETSAICHWLTDQFPDREFAPQHNSPARLEYTQWMYYVPATMEPPMWYAFLHSNILPDEQKVPDIIPWCENLYDDVFGVLNRAYENKNYLIENRFSTVDLMIGSMLLWYARQASNYSELRRVLQDFSQRPAFRRAREEISHAA